MEKIGLLSDTHGNLALQREAAEFLVHHGEIDRFYHCGDDYSDAEPLLHYGLPLIRVPGIFEIRYKKRLVPIIEKDEVEEWRINLVHDLNDMLPELLQEADIIVYGHSHDYKAEKREGRIFINPGHLKDITHKNRPATFGIITLTKTKLSVNIFGLDKKILLDQEFTKENL
jgi:hypothetical protein